MKVILLERVGTTGHIGDEVTVKDGFARNFLLPQHKALRATEANRKRFEAERASIEKRNAERREAAAGIADRPQRQDRDHHPPGRRNRPALWLGQLARRRRGA